MTPKTPQQGGLINELELKIEESTNLTHHLEMKIKSLENDNSQLNYEYTQSFKVFNEDINLEKLINYRQSLIDQICNNNNYIDELNLKLNKTIKTCKFYKRMYFHLNK